MPNWRWVLVNILERFVQVGERIAGLLVKWLNKESEW